MLDIKCLKCAKTFQDYPSNNRKFCSKKCKANDQVIDKTLSCNNCNKTFTFQRNNRSYNRRKYCSSGCLKEALRIIKTGCVVWNKGIKYDAISGDKHWNWKGGNRRGKRGSEQRRFRIAVLKRDNYSCVKCNATDKKLIADHIKPYAYYPELREVIDNGRTLCVDCNYESTYIKKEWSIT